MEICKSIAVVATIVFSVGACTKREVVVLLPESDGTVGNLTVTEERAGGGQVELSEPFAAARVGGALGSGAREGSLSLEQIEERFGEVTGILPDDVERFVIYFETGQSSLSQDDIAVLQELRESIDLRPAAEIEVVGHTDTVGNGALNDQLSIERAISAREALVGQLGIASDRITASGRGERQLAVETADDTPNTQNRRVELRLR